MSLLIDYKMLIIKSLGRKVSDYNFYEVKKILPVYCHVFHFHVINRSTAKISIVKK